MIAQSLPGTFRQGLCLVRECLRTAVSLVADPRLIMSGALSSLQRWTSGRALDGQVLASVLVASAVAFHYRLLTELPLL